MNLKIKCFLLLLFLVFMTVFVYFFVRFETPIYICDKVEQNLFFYDYSKLFVNNIGDFLTKMQFEIYNLNRNPFMNIFLLPFYFIFKESRFGYILAVNIVFMLPCMMLLYTIFNKYFLPDEKKGNLLSIAVCSCIFLSTAYWQCSLQGVPDICGMVCVLIAFILYLKTDLKDKFSPLNIILISVLLYLSFLMRRWYSVVILSFILSMLLENFILCVIETKNIKNILKLNFISCLNIGLMSALIGIMAYIIQGGYVRRILEGAENAERAIYTVEYNQWQVIFIDYLGIILLAFAIIGTVCYLKNHTVRFTALNLIIYTLLFIVFMNNQFIWINHYLFISSMLLLLISFGIFKVSNIIKNKKGKFVFLIFFIIFNILNFSTYFIFDKNNNSVFRLIPSKFCYPYISSDYGKVKNIYSYLKSEYEKDNNIKVAVYGLNNSIGYYQLRSLDPKSDFAKNNILSETILDSDFHGYEVNADFIIFINPHGIYNDLALSNVLVLTHQIFMNNTGIAKNYEEVMQETLQNGETVKVYKRLKPLTKKQIKNYLEPFFEFLNEGQQTELKKLYE